MRTEAWFGGRYTAFMAIKAANGKKSAMQRARKGTLRAPPSKRTEETMTRQLEWKQSKALKMEPAGRAKVQLEADQRRKERRERDAEEWIKKVRARREGSE
jgi:hypothetical protein